MQEVYAQMSDDELQNVADEAYDLTDVAKEALKSEVKSRGADIRLRLERPANNEPEPEPEIEEVDEEQSEPVDPAEYDLITFGTLTDREEARKTKWVLDNAGIPSWIGSQNVESVDEYKGSFEHGVALKIRSIDRNRAGYSLSRHWPEDSEATSEREPEPEPESAEAEVRCPKCHSNEVVFESLDRKTTDDAMLDAKFNWHCDACGHDWQDEGIEQEV